MVRRKLKIKDRIRSRIESDNKSKIIITYNELQKLYSQNLYIVNNKM